MIPDNSSVLTPKVSLCFFTTRNLVKIFSKGILFGVSVQIFPLVVLKGFSFRDSLVHVCSCCSPKNAKFVKMKHNGFFYSFFFVN